MKRFHVHVAVDDLGASVRFYSTMFAASPTVLKEDYAKWALDDPRVNFAISRRGAALGLNHLGVQVETVHELSEMEQRLQALRVDVRAEPGAACCYAKSDKYWATDPQGIAWETFHTLDSIPVFGSAEHPEESAASCIPLANPTQAETAPCCVPAATSRAKSGTCC